MNNIALYTVIQWSAVFIYIIATIRNVYGVVFEHEKAERRSYLIAWAGLAVHGSAIIYFWVMAAHGPYITRNEIFSSDAWIMLAFFLLFSRFFPVIRPASIFIFPATFLLIALGLFYSPYVRNLPPTFTGIWLVIHIFFYKIALATIMISLAFSVFYLMKRKRDYHWLARLPKLDTIDIYAYRFAGFGFVFWAIAMLSGSIWAYGSWGRFWAWDPVETWSLITWLFLGLHLHLRRFFRWRGEKSAYFYIFCFLLSVATIFFLSHLSTSIHAEYFK